MTLVDPSTSVRMAETVIGMENQDENDCVIGSSIDIDGNGVPVMV